VVVFQGFVDSWLQALVNLNMRLEDCLGGSCKEGFQFVCVASVACASSSTFTTANRVILYQAPVFLGRNAVISCEY